MERAWITVLTEAGARVATGITVQDHFPDVVHTDHRRLDLVAHGLRTDGGLPVCADVTLRSPVTRSGDPRFNAQSTNGATFGPATREKERKYPEYVSATHLKFRVLACEVGGRFSDSCRDWLAALATASVAGSSEDAAESKRTLLLRRWWTLLSVALQTAVAEGLSDGQVSGPRESPLQELDYEELWAGFSEEPQFSRMPAAG